MRVVYSMVYLWLHSWHTGAFAMPQLKNHRYEQVAQGIAAGLTQLDACRAAGYTMKNRTSAFRIIRRPEIRARVAELQAPPVDLVGEWAANLGAARAGGDLKAAAKALTHLTG